MMKAFLILYFVLVSLLIRIEFTYSIKRKIQGKGLNRKFQLNHFEENQDGASNDVDFSQTSEKSPQTGGITSNDETDPKLIENKSSEGIELGEGIFINPCTGSISADTIYNGDTFPCLQATNIPSASASNQPSSSPVLTLVKEAKVTPSPTISLKPTTYHSMMPSSSIQPSVSPVPSPSISKEPSMSPVPSISISPTVLLDTISCPGMSHECDGSNDNSKTIIVNFNYSVETTSEIDDPYIVLPKLEKALLQYLVDNILDHCRKSISIRKMLEISNKSYGTEIQNRRRLYKYNERSLQQGNQTHIVGLCSLPKDEYIEEDSCKAELNNLNKCFVIKGDVTVFLDDEADLIKKEIITIIQNKTKDAMVNDELLTEDNQQVKKVKYLEDEVDDINAIDDVERASGDPPIGIAIGASLMALAGLLGFYLVKRQINKFAVGSKLVDDDDDDEDVPNSFIAPDSKDLGKVSTVMDVHECKSAVCPKCYNDPNVAFIRVHPDQYKRSIILEQKNSMETLEGGISSDDSMS